VKETKIGKLEEYNGLARLADLADSAEQAEEV
jgi:hypothetical protein